MTWKQLIKGKLCPFLDKVEVENKVLHRLIRFPNHRDFKNRFTKLWACMVLTERVCILISVLV